MHTHLHTLYVHICFVAILHVLTGVSMSAGQGKMGAIEYTYCLCPTFSVNTCTHTHTHTFYDICMLE